MAQASKTRSKSFPSTPKAPRIAIAIMAAGKGTRLKSKHPKVLHEVGGKPILAHVIATAQKIVPAQDIFVIVGHEAERVRAAMAGTGVNFVQQAEQRGTGHALMVAREALSDNDNKAGNKYDQVIVLSGDAPLITAETIRKLSEFHVAQKATMTLLSADLDNPYGYGRVIRKSARGGAEVLAIVEEKAATASQRNIREINSGFYAFDAPALYEHIDRLSTANAHGEYYLTDMAGVFHRAHKKVVAFKTEDAGEVLGCNTRAEMVMLDARVRLAKCRELLDAGVTIFYPHTCVIDSDVQVGADTVIEPFVQLLGKTKIAEDCRIRSYSVIGNSVLGNGVTVKPGTIMEDSRVGAGAVLGPYTHMRPGSEVGEGAHLGNFVETKKIKLGKGSKANHLSYLGDAEIGEGVNIGAGTITCNYDGVKKHKTVIEDGVFVGSDSTLVAPLTIGRGAYVAAASCITEDVPADALALGRARQSVKEGWAQAKREARKPKVVPQLQKTDSMSGIERLRRSFYPDQITTLFVGEAPPDGGTFFYKGDSILHHKMKESFGAGANFLAEFKAKGFYLDDLVLQPINKVESKKDRKTYRRMAIPSLAQRMAEYRPAAIVALMSAIKPMVVDAMRSAGLSHIPLYVVPFPIHWHEKTFKAKMEEIIPKLPFSEH